MHLFVSHDNCSPNYTAFCHNIYAQNEPLSFKEVSQHDSWKHTMGIGLNAFDKNQTRTLVSPSFGIKPISCRWVYKLKWHY